MAQATTKCVSQVPTLREDSAWPCLHQLPISGANKCGWGQDLKNSPQSGPPSRRRMDNLLGVHYPRTNKKKTIFTSVNAEFIVKKALNYLGVGEERRVSYIGKL